MVSHNVGYFLRLLLFTLISQAVFSGMTISTCIWGYISDNFGRKKVNYLSIIYLLCILAC